MYVCMYICMDVHINRKYISKYKRINLFKCAERSYNCIFFIARIVTINININIFLKINLYYVQLNFPIRVYSVFHVNSILTRVPLYQQSVLPVTVVFTNPHRNSKETHIYTHIVICYLFYNVLFFFF